MKTRITTQEKATALKEYFKTNVGPVFCRPSKGLIHTYQQMAGLIGVIHPMTAEAVRNGSQLFFVDWTLNPKWESLATLYSSLEKTKFGLHEIDIINFRYLGIGIPGSVNEAYGNYSWKPKKLGDVVCISDIEFTKWEAIAPKLAKPFIPIKHMIGVVVEKCDNIVNQTMVSFRCNEEVKVTNVPTDLLMRLPESFRSINTTKATQPIVSTMSKNKAKFKIGQTVRISQSVKDENFMGLLGLVHKVHEILPPEGGFKTLSRWEYDIDFDLLPNRNLSLCIGESTEPSDTLTITTLRECDLDTWDEKISDKGYFGLYRVYGKRDCVWVPHHKQLGKVDVRFNAKKSLNEGMKIEVRINNEDFTMSCRDVDYKYDPDALKEILSISYICLGFEKENRNPNIKSQQNVYMYVFDYLNDIGKYVRCRILLGTLASKASVLRDFNKALLANKLKHPWQIRRYLQVGSLGYFYQLFTANEYLETVSEFHYA